MFGLVRLESALHCSSDRVHSEGVDSTLTATYVTRRGYGLKLSCRQRLPSLAQPRVVKTDDRILLFKDVGCVRARVRALVCVCVALPNATLGRLSAVSVFSRGVCR